MGHLIELIVKTAADVESEAVMEIALERLAGESSRSIRLQERAVEGQRGGESRQAGSVATSFVRELAKLMPGRSRSVALPDKVASTSPQNKAFEEEKFYDILAHVKEPLVGEITPEVSRFYAQCTEALPLTLLDGIPFARALWKLRWRRARRQWSRILAPVIPASWGGIFGGMLGTLLAILVANNHLLSSIQGTGFGAIAGALPGSLGFGFLIGFFTGLGAELLGRRPILGKTLGGAVGGLTAGILLAIILAIRADPFAIVVWVPAGLLTGLFGALAAALLESRSKHPSVSGTFLASFAAIAVVAPLFWLAIWFGPFELPPSNHDLSELFGECIRWPFVGAGIMAGRRYSINRASGSAV